jgi:hypothetical protein
MNDFQIIWTMITTLLAAYYDSINVFDAYQNNYTLPTHNNFIIITQKDIGKAPAYPLRDFDVLTQEKILTPFGDYEFQVDLYGINADTAAHILHTYVDSSAGSNYLIPYQKGIGKVKPTPINASRKNDRENYMKRYIVTFTVLNTNIVRIPMPGFGLADVELNYKEYT